jgi:hypothetical protein
VPGVSVVVSSAGKRAEARTDAEGRFRVKGLPPGHVQASLAPPEGFNARERQQTKPARPGGCAFFHFDLYRERPNGPPATDRHE